MTIKLWHCAGSRSVRPLWTLEEMGLEYEVISMPFPPRTKYEGYLKVNKLGTVPYFEDDTVSMTESSGICLYLVEKYKHHNLRVAVDDPEYAEYINWLFHSDATLTFPQTIFLRFTQFERSRGLEEAGLAYADWFRKRLIKLEDRLAEREYLVCNRFTIADITIGYALYLASAIQILDTSANPNATAYLKRLMARPSFQRALQIGAEFSPLKP